MIAVGKGAKPHAERPLYKIVQRVHNTIHCLQAPLNSLMNKEGVRGNLGFLKGRGKGKPWFPQMWVFG
jgi:hypothetical protein